VTFPASGWRRDLSPRARREIERSFPTLPVDEISSEVGWYVILRDAKSPSPAEARETLRNLQRLARELNDAVQPMALGPLRSFIEQAAGLIGSPVSLKDLRTALFYFDRSFSKAVTFIPKGRRRSPRERLVRALVNILLAAGEPIDARPQGTLCRLVDIVLRDVGETPSDVRKLAQPLVRELENSREKPGAFSGRVC
jgi:hypothetical protein